MDKSYPILVRKHIIVRCNYFIPKPDNFVFVVNFKNVADRAQRVRPKAENGQINPFNFSSITVYTP